MFELCDICNLKSITCSNGGRPSAPRCGEVKHLYGNESWCAAHARLGQFLQLRYSYTNNLVSLLCKVLCKSQKLLLNLFNTLFFTALYHKGTFLKEDLWMCSPWLNTLTIQETVRLKTSQQLFILNSRYGNFSTYKKKLPIVILKCYMCLSLLWDTEQPTPRCILHICFVNYKLVP